MTLLDHTISLGVIGGDAYMLNIVLVGEDIESLNEGWTVVSDNLCQCAVVFLGKDTVAQKSVPMFACFSLKSITPNRI